ncbi:SMP-30/gluconolactonase/LRE family protein [Fibrella arboris]|uniref:SMP-30/gluconolactonase/LRE family protein n=1 Tax=Fibrella arboris TaxID=3242486 RepID=UPI003521155B
MHISSFFAGNLQLGEGIFVDQRHNHVWWVDILERRVYRSHADGTDLHTWQTPELVGFVLPHPDGERYWLGLQSGPHAAYLRELQPPDLQRLGTAVNTTSPQIRVNDGSLSVDGQSLFVTTMDMDAAQPVGRLLCYDLSGSVMDLLANFIIGNGPAVASDRPVVYVAESEGHAGRAKGVYAVDLQAQSPTEKRLIEWPYEGSPDGVSMGAAGTLWVGTYGGNHIRQFTPAGQLIRTIELPALNVTKVAAVGNQLYVTSAATGVSEAQRHQYPLTGHVLVIDSVE